MKKLKKLFQQLRLNHAIKKANKFHNLTGYKYLVLNYKGKPVVKSKRSLKEMIKNGELNTTIQYLEQIALYKTL
ncbi:MAG: hypothetical protein IKU05_05370 [Bacteroidales bacterium]|nr:hypothetical protein [Bacteroidales bacterium]MBR6438033.1 hypothetical protein [Bacteroidales bacterium]